MEEAGTNLYAEIVAEGDGVGALALSEQVSLVEVGGEHSEIKLGEEEPCMTILM
jgi:hypothetical protein